MTEINKDLFKFWLKPYFYTLQTHLETKKKQLSIWSFITYQYFLKKDIKEISVNELNNDKFLLYHNKKINRELDEEFINLILNELENKNKIKFKDSNKSFLYVLKISIKDLANSIYTFAKKNNLINKIETIYFFTSGEFNENEVFYGYPEEIIIEAIKHLEKENKGNLIEFEGKYNVKFL